MKASPVLLLTAVGCLLIGAGRVARAEGTPAAKAALVRAVKFFHQDVATHGGYVYQYSADLSLREAEGVPDRDTIWVQPPELAPRPTWWPRPRPPP